MDVIRESYGSPREQALPPDESPLFQNVLNVGMEVSIGPGRFRVKSFGRKVVVLEAMPGTAITRRD
jgi:hypothetical protein